MKNKILYVYTGGHKIHEKFARTVTKDVVKFSDNLPRDYDVYLFEGEYVRPVLMRMLGKIPRKAKIITLFSDPRLFYLRENLVYGSKSGKLKKGFFLKNMIKKILLKKLDGAMVAGDFQRELFRESNKKSPVGVFYPFIEEEKYKKLKGINPNLNKKNILFIGHGPDPYVKGLDVLIEMFIDLKKEIEDLRLYILGEKWDIKPEWKLKDVFFEGKKDIFEYLKRCSLGVHFGRGEGFGVNVIEMMRAGIPVIVSEFTGSKEFVEKLDKDFVVPLTKEIILRKINNYFKLDIKSKKNLSKRAKRATDDLNEMNQLKEFKNEFNQLLLKLK